MLRPPLTSRSVRRVLFVLPGLLGVLPGGPEGAASPPDAQAARERFFPPPVLPPAPVEPGVYAMELAAADPDGSLRFRVSLAGASSTEGVLSFTAFRLRPGMGAGGVEAVMTERAEVDVPAFPAPVDLFRNPSRPPAAGPHRLELRRVRDGVEGDAPLAVADVWRGSVEDWIRSFEEDHAAARGLLDSWRGEGHSDDLRALSRASNFRYFDSPRFLYDVYRVEDREAQSKIRLDEHRANPGAVSAGGGIPEGSPLSLGPVPERGGDSVAPALGTGQALPSGVGDSVAPALGTGQVDSKTGAAAPGGSPSFRKVRDRFAREALANFLLALEGWSRQATALGVDAAEVADDWNRLWECHRYLCNEEPAVRRLSESADLARLAAKGPSGADPAGRTSADQAREIRLRIGRNE